MLWGDSCTLRPLLINGKFNDTELEGLVIIESDRVLEDLCVLDYKVVEDSVDGNLEFEDLAVVARISVLCEDSCTLEELMVNDGVDDTNCADWVVVESDRAIESPCALDNRVFEGGADDDLILEGFIVVVPGLVLCEGSCTLEDLVVNDRVNEIIFEEAGVVESICMLEGLDVLDNRVVEDSVEADP